MRLFYLVFASFLICGGCGGGGNGGGGTPGDSDQVGTDSDDTGDVDANDDDQATQDDDDGTCTEGAKRCGSDDVRFVETCQSDGSWAVSTVCPYVCSSGGCGGECGPGSQRCCVRNSDYTKTCGNDYVLACVGTDEQCYAGHPLEVFIETCGSAGYWAETSACDLCNEDVAFANPYMACDTCSFAVGAKCSPQGGGCGSACE